MTGTKNPLIRRSHRVSCSVDMRSKIAIAVAVVAVIATTGPAGAQTRRFLVQHTEEGTRITEVKPSLLSQVVSLPGQVIGWVVSPLTGGSGFGGPVNQTDMAHGIAPLTDTVADTSRRTVNTVGNVSGRAVNTVTNTVNRTVNTVTSPLRTQKR